MVGAEANLINKNPKLLKEDEERPLDPRNLCNRYYDKCLEKAGLRRVRFHDLRHTFASIHYISG
jgi:integrase